MRGGWTGSHTSCRLTHLMVACSYVSKYERALAQVHTGAHCHSQRCASCCSRQHTPTHAPHKAAPCLPLLYHDLLYCLYHSCLPQVELFQEAFKDVAEQLLQESGHIEKPAAAPPRTVTVYKPLPRWDTHTHRHINTQQSSKTAGCCTHNTGGRTGTCNTTKALLCGCVQAAAAARAAPKNTMVSALCLVSCYASICTPQPPCSPTSHADAHTLHPFKLPLSTCPCDPLRHPLKRTCPHSQHTPPPPCPCPPPCRCIIENKEPFAHKDWRREPYEPRPYTPLTEYAITTNVPAEVRPSGCSTHAMTHAPCVPGLFSLLIHTCLSTRAHTL